MFDLFCFEILCFFAEFLTFASNGIVIIRCLWYYHVCIVLLSFALLCFVFFVFSCNALFCRCLVKLFCFALLKFPFIVLLFLLSFKFFLVGFDLLNLFCLVLLC